MSDDRAVQTRPTDVEPYLSKRAVADRLDVSTRTVERAMSAGLRHYRVVGQVRLRWSDVVEHFGLAADEAEL